MDAAQFREAALKAVDEITNYRETILDRPVVSTVEPGYLKKLLPDGFPEEGEPWEGIQRDVEGVIMPGLTHWNHPNFMAFFPSNTSFPSMLGELYSAALSAPAFNWICSPAITELETVIMDWLAKLIALPDCFTSEGRGGGVIQGTASEALATCMIAARDKYARAATRGLEGLELEDALALKRSRLVALGSEMAHSSTQKAALIAGVRYRSIPVSRDNDYAMTGEDVEKVILDCRAQGLEPFYLTVSLGTTSTCAIDQFSSISAVLSRLAPAGSPQEVWVHVDAAYAGSALLLPQYQHLTTSFAKFHSFNFNLHKWLLVNFDASCLWVRERNDLIDSLSVDPSYLRNAHSSSGLVTDYRDWQIPLGRRFRSLKIWFVFRSYGVNALRVMVQEHIDLGLQFAEEVESRPDLFEIIAKPAFALTVFRVALPGTNEEKNQMTKEVYEKINAEGEIFITSSLVGGIYAIRVVSANEKTEEKYLKRAFAILLRTTVGLRDGRAVGQQVEGNFSPHAL